MGGMAMAHDRQGDVFKQAIADVTSVDALHWLGAAAQSVANNWNEVKRQYTKDVVRRLSALQFAATVLLAPRCEDADRCLMEIQDVQPGWLSVQAPIRVGVVMRFIEAGRRLQKLPEIGDALLAQLIDWRSKGQPSFQLPIFFLHACMATPCPENPELQGNARYDCMLLYYAGCLRGQAGEYAAADEFLRYSWALSKAAPDAREGIVTFMSIVSFLSHVPRVVFEARVKPQFRQQSQHKDLWDLRPGFRAPQAFAVPVKQERLRRALFQYAQAVSQIKLDDLLKALQADVNEVMLAAAEVNTEQGDRANLIDVNTDKGVVKFTAPRLNAKAHEALRDALKKLRSGAA